MKKHLRNRIVAFLLIFSMLFVLTPAASAADTDGFRCEKTAVRNDDGTVRISLRAFQTGTVPAADIVMVLDVSGSMENSTPISAEDLVGTKDYYIRYVRTYTDENGELKGYRVNVRVHNTAADGQTPVWFGQLEANGPEETVLPGDGTNGTYQFYTGAMDALRAAATEFVHSIAQNAMQYEADHRVAVVEFSSPVPKGTDALCTHTTQDDPYYANILTGDGTASGALVSAQDGEQALSDVFASLTAAGPTYSDDAMTQAKRILSASAASRRVVILFTDGGPGSYGWDYDNDSSSLLTANGAIAAAGEMKKNGVQIYTIGVFNEENLAGETGELNRTYLSLVSSNYPDAESMTRTGTQNADGCCSIGDQNMDLSGAFNGISAVLGEPVDSAEVRDTVSEYFYLTDAQRQALLEAYPQAQISENDDGTTTVSLDAVDFPPVAVHGDGSVANENDDGIFTMSFDVTPRENFLGGSVCTNSGSCGVFSRGVEIAQFSVPTVDVPISASALDRFLDVTPQTIYTDQTLSADMLYTDHSLDPGADFVPVSYAVTDPDGEPFTERTMTTAGTYSFTVTANAELGGQTCTREKTVQVTVIEDTPERLELVTKPTKTQYLFGEPVQLDGIEATLWMRSGKSIALTAQQLSVSPETLSSLGTQTVTVTYEDVSMMFDVTVEPHEPTLTLTAAPNKTTYLYGETLDTTGLTITYTDEYGEAFAVTEGFVCEPTALTALGTQTITATYAGLSVTFDVTVEPHEPTLTLTAAPNKTTYLYGESLDTAGLTLTYTDEYGEAFAVTESFVCEPTALTALGTQTITATYAGLSVTFDVTVEPHEPTLTLKAAPDKTTYLYGETLDTTGLTLTYTDIYGDALVVNEGYVCVPTMLTALGSQTVTATYAGLSVTFDVTVGLHEPTLTLKTAPTKTTYFVGDSLDTAGLTLAYMDAYGDVKTVSFGFVCDTQTLQNSGSQTVTVTYAELSVTFDVTVREVVAVSLTVVSEPTNGTYTYKSAPDFSGLTVRVKYNNGHEETVRDLSKMTVQAESNVRVRRGVQTFRVSTQGVSATFEMHVRLVWWQWLILILLFGWIWY